MRVEISAIRDEIKGTGAPISYSLGFFDGKMFERLHLYTPG